MGRYICGMVAGLIVGATVGVILLPQLDKKTQRKIRRARQKFMDFAEDSYDDMREMIN